MFHSRMSRKRQLRSHSWMLSKKMKLQRSRRAMAPRIEFNRVLWSRSSKFLLFQSLRISLRCLSLGRKIKRNEVTKHVEVPQVQVVEKTIGIPQLEIVEQIVETPETQTIQGARTSERSGTAPVRHATQTEGRWSRVRLSEWRTIRSRC